MEKKKPNPLKCYKLTSINQNTNSGVYCVIQLRLCQALHDNRKPAVCSACFTARTLRRLPDHQQEPEHAPCPRTPWGGRWGAWAGAVRWEALAAGLAGCVWGCICSFTRPRTVSRVSAWAPALRLQYPPAWKRTMIFQKAMHIFNYFLHRSPWVITWENSAFKIEYAPIFFFLYR